MKQAVMIIIFQENKFLLGKRSSWKEKAPDFWCPISGHIEQSETEEDAVKREAMEELGIEVLPMRKIASTLTLDKTVMLHWWTAAIASGKPTLSNNENSEIRWFNKEELQKLRPVFKEDIDILLSVFTSHFV